MGSAILTKIGQNADRQPIYSVRWSNTGEGLPRRPLRSTREMTQLTPDQRKRAFPRGVDRNTPGLRP